MFIPPGDIDRTRPGASVLSEVRADCTSETKCPTFTPEPRCLLRMAASNSARVIIPSWLFSGVAKAFVGRLRGDALRTTTRWAGDTVRIVTAPATDSAC